MIKRILIISVGFLFLQSCSSDDEVIPPVNSKPGILTIENISFNGKQVTIDWNDVEDNDEDKIYYKLYIDSKLIDEFTESIAITELQYNSSFEGRIIATDKKGGISEIVFSIESPKSKILLFAAGGGKLIAYDLIVNKVLWESESLIDAAHTVDQNRVFTGVNILDLLSGEIISSIERTDNDYRDIIVDENSIYAVGNGGFGTRLFSFNVNTGIFNWEISFLNVFAPLSMDDRNIFVSSRNNDYLYAFNKDNAELKWSYGLDPNTTSSAPQVKTNPLIAGDNIYFGDNIGRFYSLNKNTGDKNWSFNAGLFNSFSASPTLYNNEIIVGTNTYLYSFNENGSQNWSYHFTNEFIIASPYVYKDDVYFTSLRNNKYYVVSVNAVTGKKNWVFELEERVSKSLIVHDDKIYIGDIEDNFYILNTNDGTLDFKFKVTRKFIGTPTLIIGAGEEVIYPSEHGLKN